MKWFRKISLGIFVLIIVCDEVEDVGIRYDMLYMKVLELFCRTKFNMIFGGG